MANLGLSSPKTNVSGKLGNIEYSSWVIFLQKYQSWVCHVTFKGDDMLMSCWRVSLAPYWKGIPVNSRFKQTVDMGEKFHNFLTSVLVSDMCERSCTSHSAGGIIRRVGSFINDISESNFYCNSRESSLSLSLIMCALTGKTFTQTFNLLK